ncbi:pyruvate, phosphate dikinase [Angustibacter sp. Root456]|uniref:pyruvate, phosphate dikinase n=1 Tax=Angustibacter sp. Root456 TaxID=1736539 RepID=UPI0009E751E7|nr:pyruvate, phosphate dikinase [Angustibacter sp. Root456]
MTTTARTHRASVPPQHSPAGAAPLVVRFEDGSRDQADLLGGKGANLCEMTRLGLPVPGGFILTTEVCRTYMASGELPAGVLAQVRDQLARVEERHGLRFGDPVQPLLVSVRSGARFSMPGMMETVLDVGLNDETVVGLAERSGERFAWDCYARLIGMYGRTVLGADAERLARATDEVRRRHGVAHESELDADGLRDLVAATRRELVADVGSDVPHDPQEQLESAILAVLRSWNSPRARLYRRREGIPDTLGTAVNVMAMVYGNAGADSGSGVCFTRDPSTGAPGAYGNYLTNAQGEDVVNGSRDALTLDHLAETQPAPHTELLRHLETLERHYRDVCDVEFTVERGRLWLLQTRIGKRTPAAAFRVARDLEREGLIDLDEAIVRVTGPQLETLMNPRFVDAGQHDVLATGHAVSAGAAVGEVALDAETAARRAAEGHDVVLVRTETSPDDLAGMVAAQAIVTSRGGVTSHAAVVARGMGRTCVVGSGLIIDLAARTVTGPDGVSVAEGDVVSVDGATGEVLRGRLDVRPSHVASALETGDAAPDDILSNAVLDLLRHADSRRRLEVFANADNGPDAARARRYGAQGVGLCRTEHMLLGERRKIVEDIVLGVGRDAAMLAFEDLQREQVRDVLAAMDGLPVVIRLLDPPLHEFLPDLVETSVELARAEAEGTATPEQERLMAALRRWSERNPMLGLRGVRLGIVMPEIFAAQVRAVADAVLDLRAEGHDPQAHLMVPLVADVAELENVRELVGRSLANVSARRGVPAPAIPLGTMIELPRAALTAGELAGRCEFFSFGTNDLTQTTWGLSRDDAESGFLPTYRELRIIDTDPFSTIDRDGVGRLVSIAVHEGRAARPDLGLGVCGEQGGDAESVHFFHDLGLDYVSCSPPRVCAARLEAGRSAVLGAVSGSDTR